MTQPAPKSAANWPDIGCGVLLFLFGIGYSVWSLFLVPQRLGNGIEGLSLLITAAGNIGVGMLAAWGLRSSRAPLWPIVGWFVGTGYFSLQVGPGGDIIIPGGLPYDPGVVKVGEFNWIAGLLSAVVVLVLAARYWGRTGSFTRGPNQPTS